ncbi:tescalcin a [Anguilla rostrata]|uniref:tescalcin a n=1 Tax=Anguilla rostrata TaxID=7938 RepID=UPI0030CDE7AB
MGAYLSAHGKHEFQELSDKTGFSLDQIANLHTRFKQLSQDEDTLRREHFENIQNLECNPIRAQIIESFFDKRNYRQNSAGKVDEITFEEFITVMSHFKPPELNMTEERREALRKEKLRFLFNMHDTDNDGTITLEEYKHVVEELLSRCSTMEKETAKSIANAAMLDVASITMGQMAPDEFYAGITFEHFQQILKGFEVESRMHIRFLNMGSTANCCK